ncbi:holin [Mycobacterium xenopi]|uniref:holin n=1 Tax=Mycobacterium xenopi TaxID=1789 RepID=UPI0018D861F9|nr:holin [Mycobacterium xenopi]
MCSGGNAVDVLHVNWVDTLSIGAGAALISVLTSIVSYKIAGQKTSTASGE